MKHKMKLCSQPFNMICSGQKTYDLRLYDEKRHMVQVNDEIEFSCFDGNESPIVVQVIALHLFKNFEELYAALPLLKCGYTKDTIDTAGPEDKNQYYSVEEQALYGVVGIEIKLKSTTTEKQMIVDTHIHLLHYLYNNEFPYLSYEAGNYVIRRGTREQLIERFKSVNIGFCVDPAIDLESNSRLLALADQMPGFIFSAVGVHPKRTFQYKRIGKDGKAETVRLQWKNRRLIDSYSKHSSVVAIGETGLDYHLPKKEQHRLHQKAWFVYQLKLAHKKNLPVVLHIREAHKDGIKILKRYKKYLHGGVCHCFSGDAKTAAAYTTMGLTIGIGAALLADSPKKAEIEQAVIHTPLECIVLETDGPYVKPDCPDFKKKQLLKTRNTSMILPAVAERIAELKSVTIEEVLSVTSSNACRLFRISN